MLTFSTVLLKQSFHFYREQATWHSFKENIIRESLELSYTLFLYLRMLLVVEINVKEKDLVTRKNVIWYLTGKVTSSWNDNLQTESINFVLKREKLKFFNEDFIQQIFEKLLATEQSNKGKASSKWERISLEDRLRFRWLVMSQPLSADKLSSCSDLHLQHIMPSLSLCLSSLIVQKLFGTSLHLHFTHISWLKLQL